MTTITASSTALSRALDNRTVLGLLFILPAAPLGGLPEATVPAARGGVGIASGTETILLAEDEPQVRELAVRMLDGLGYQLIGVCRRSAP